MVHCSFYVWLEGEFGFEVSLVPVACPWYCCVWGFKG